MRPEEPWGLHWFRRDLRVSGNSGLRWNWKQHSGRVLGLFCFDAKFLKRTDFSHNRFHFFLNTLRELKLELQKQGGDLLVADGLAQDVFPSLLHYWDSKKMARPATVTWCRDYEPFARQRDTHIEQNLAELQMPTKTFRDHVLLEPHEVLKSDGSFYQVYSPFARQWFEHLHSEAIQSRLREQESSREYVQRWKNGEPNAQLFRKTWDLTADFPYRDRWQQFHDENQKHVDVPMPAAGFLNAFQTLQSFSSRLQAYKEQRDFPARPGTSKLSIYFKNGSLTSSQVLHELKLGQHAFKETGGPAHFVKEIAWREFYYSILFHRPENETHSFLPQYENLAWQNNTSWFERWTEGKTGFPIVDAGMRELNTTGWMHNRVRMIVASFLTKDLLIDWRWGENYFMKKLLDGDLAPNNGGWQWAASTGCDPQPYFRIFNPWLQSKKFDPDGTYIKTFLPELKDSPGSALHDPESERGSAYPRPMVAHEVQRAKALALYKIDPVS